MSHVRGHVCMYINTPVPVRTVHACTASPLGGHRGPGSQASGLIIRFTASPGAHLCPRYNASSATRQGCGPQGFQPQDAPGPQRVPAERRYRRRFRHRGHAAAGPRPAPRRRGGEWEQVAATTCSLMGQPMTSVILGPGAPPPVPADADARAGLDPRPAPRGLRATLWTGPGPRGVSPQSPEVQSRPRRKGPGATSQGLAAADWLPPPSEGSWHLLRPPGQGEGGRPSPSRAARSPPRGWLPAPDRKAPPEQRQAEGGIFKRSCFLCFSSHVLL